MGIIRKTMSVSTMGLVDFRSDKERTARYTRQTRNAARVQVAQGAVDLEVQRQQLAALDHANVREATRPVAAEPGWYADPGDPEAVRWFDGQQWTGFVQAAVAAPPATASWEPTPLPPVSPPPAATAPSTGVAEELTKLASLVQQGFLSADEFETAKRRLLHER